MVVKSQIGKMVLTPYFGQENPPTIISFYGSDQVLTDDGKVKPKSFPELSYH